MKQKILFVCLGNICRSPAAEGIFRNMVVRRGLADEFEIDSAGTYGGHAGELPDPRMRKAGAARGYDFDSRSRQIRRSDFDDFDRIIVMDDSNYERVHRLAASPEDVEKIHRMVEFQTRHNADHVPDPYYEGAEGFEIVLDLLEDCCEGALNEFMKSEK